VAVSLTAAPPLAQAATAIAARTSPRTWSPKPSEGASSLPADAPLLPPVVELLTYEDICTTPAKMWHKLLKQPHHEPPRLVFAETLRTCYAEPESNAVHQQMLTFFKCLLWAPAVKLLRGASVATIVGWRLDRWQEGVVCCSQYMM
jgi:hypothetical protein